MVKTSVNLVELKAHSVIKFVAFIFYPTVMGETSWKKWDSKGKKRKLLQSAMQTIHDQSPAAKAVFASKKASNTDCRPQGTRSGRQ